MILCVKLPYISLIHYRTVGKHGGHYMAVGSKKISQLIWHRVKSPLILMLIRMTRARHIKYIN